MKKIIAIGTVVLLLLSIICYLSVDSRDAFAVGGYFTKIYTAVGGDSLTVKNGGFVNFFSGGTLNMSSGSTFVLGGTTVSSSAAELNLIDGSVAGTAVASKAAVLGATKNLDYIDLTDEGGGIAFRNNMGGAGADSALIITFSSGCPVLTFGASSTGVFALTVTTGDAASFTGASAGYTFDAVIDGTDISATTIGATTPSSAAFTTLSTSGASTLGAAVTATPSITARANAGGAGNDSSFAITFAAGMPILSFYSASGAGAYTQTVTDADVAAFAGAAGGYTFDAVIDGTDIKNTTIGAGGASSGSFTTLAATGIATLADIAAGDVVGSLTSTNITYVAFRANEGGAGADSSMQIGFSSGTPFFKWFGTDGDTFTQTMTTDDKATFTGATGGYNFDVAVTSPLNIINLDADTTLTVAMSPVVIVARALTAKRTVTFPTDPTGLDATFLVADADSLVISAASGDSILDGGFYSLKMAAAGSGASFNTLNLKGISASAIVGNTSSGTWAKY